MLRRLTLALWLVPTLAAAQAAQTLSIRPLSPPTRPLALAPVAKPVAAATRPPFPPPALGPVDAETRFTSGVVVAVDPNAKSFRVTATAGEITCKIIDKSRIIGSDGQPAPFASLMVGAALRVYYATGKGAIVQEVDLVPTR